MNHIPCELRAVLHIFNADDELRKKALPYVCNRLGGIDWYSILSQDLSSKHRAAIAWAKCLWMDQIGQANPFELAFYMDEPLRRTVVEAIAIRWCIPLAEAVEMRMCA